MTYSSGYKERFTILYTTVGNMVEIKHIRPKYKTLYNCFYMVPVKNQFTDGSLLQGEINYPLNFHPFTSSNLHRKRTSIVEERMSINLRTLQNQRMNFPFPPQISGKSFIFVLNGTYTHTRSVDRLDVLSRLTVQVT